MPLFNFSAPEMTIVLSGKYFSFGIYFHQFWCWRPWLHTKQLAHILVITNLICVNHGTGQWLQYGRDWFILSCPTKQYIGTRKKLWEQILNGPSRSCSCCNMTCTSKFKLVIVKKSLRPRCFGRWLPTNYGHGFAHQMTWMTSNVFESWMNHVVFNLVIEQYCYCFLITQCYKCGTNHGLGTNCFIQSSI